MLKWWQKAVFYQIYPRSFADGNGDGIGDLKGIIQKLGYLQDLGIDAIWLSPHYPSPQFDCGYDIQNYIAVEPQYGTLEDFQHFLQAAHQRGIRVILDLVLNHTSHLHPWFAESRSSRDNPKRDWYIWRDGRDGEISGPPNNWESTFGGPAWELDPQTGQYYYHFFFKEQPDLNWRNPQVKQAMFDAVRFWLEMGVDGFRLDAIATLFEHPGLPDHTPALSLKEIYRLERIAKTTEQMAVALDQRIKLQEYQIEQPGIHELMRELRRLVDEYDDRVLVGEVDDIAYYGDGSDELHMVFNFPLLRTAKMTPDWVRENQRMRLDSLPPGAWPCNTLGNHDLPRVYSRYCDPVDSSKRCNDTAKLSLALMLTLKGTPFLYNGEEIGMTDFLLADLDQFRDILGLWAYQMEIDIPGVSPDLALKAAARYGRDKCRTPMQWANQPNGGFSPPDVQTWLPVNPNFFQGVNVADQNDDPGSLLNFYRRMLNLRRETPALISGEFIPLLESSTELLVFLRTFAEQTCLVILNYTNRPVSLKLEQSSGSLRGLDSRQARLLFSSQRQAGSPVDLDRLKIEPLEILVVEPDLVTNR